MSATTASIHNIILWVKYSFVTIDLRGAAAGSSPGSGGGGRRRSLKFTIPPINLPPPVTLRSFCASYSGGTSKSHPLLVRSTVGLLEVFGEGDPLFHYDRRLNPRRVLTRPNRPAHNNGWDNEKHDYILYVNDIIGNEEGRR